MCEFLFPEPARKRKKREELEYNGKPSPMVTINNSEPPPLPDDGDARSKKKKARTTFTGRQIFELEKQFEMKKYLSSSERSEMAKLLNVTETQVGRLLFFFLNLWRDSDKAGARLK